MADLWISIPYPLSPELAELIAQRLRVIGDPVRIRLLDHLREGEASVASLTETLGATQQNVSKHLQVLHQAGIVGRRKEGTSVLYRIVDSSVFELCELVCGGLQRQLSDLNALVQGESQ